MGTATRKHCREDPRSFVPRGKTARYASPVQPGICSKVVWTIPFKLDNCWRNRIRPGRRWPAEQCQWCGGCWCRRYNRWYRNASEKEHSSPEKEEEAWWSWAEEGQSQPCATG